MTEQDFAVTVLLFALAAVIGLTWAAAWHWGGAAGPFEWLLDL